MIAEHKASAVVRGTGQILEIPINTVDQITDAYEQVEQTIIAYRELKRQITDRGMVLLKRTTTRDTLKRKDTA